MRSAAVLGVNAVFDDSAAALLVDGELVDSAAGELPEKAARRCLRRAGLEPGDLDAVACSYDPTLAVSAADTGDPWECLRTTFACHAPRFLATELRGLDPTRIRFVPHHVAHAASAYHGAGFDSCAVLVLDGRGEATSHLAGHYRGGKLEVLARQRLPHSLGLLYEGLTAHLGLQRSSDGHEMMAIASAGRPAMLEEMRELVGVEADGGFRAEPVAWKRFAPRLESGDAWTPLHADLAASVQARLEEVLLALAEWLAERTGEGQLTMAGGVALNCVANSRLSREGPFGKIWVQPTKGDSGSAYGAASLVSEQLGAAPQPMRAAAVRPGGAERELDSWLQHAGGRTFARTG